MHTIAGGDRALKDGFSKLPKTVFTFDGTGGAGLEERRLGNFGTES